MTEQCSYIQSCGFSATFIGKDSDENEDLLDGKFQFLFSSPESVLSINKWRDMLKVSDSFRLGESETEMEPFRVWYGKLGELRSLIDCPLLLITATANESARKQMEKKFCMQNCHEIIQNPDRVNIKLFMQKVKGSVPLCDVFYFLLHLLKEKKENCERFLIFCPSIKLCSQVFTMFRLELNSEIKHIVMYHSKTTENMKERIKHVMDDPNGITRVLIATSAAGMGVNLKGVNNVINFGPPKDMDGFVQQFGRAGRDGSSAMAILIYFKRQCRNLDQDMKVYVENNDLCRRELLLKAYKSKPSNNRVKHLCCDICASGCNCGADDCKAYTHSYYDIPLPQFSDSDSDSCLESDFSEESN